jgi:hypothetical protein
MNNHSGPRELQLPTLPPFHKETKEMHPGMREGIRHIPYDCKPFTAPGVTKNDWYNSMNTKHFSFPDTSLDTPLYVYPADTNTKFTDEEKGWQEENWNQFRLMTCQEFPIMRYTNSCVARMAFVAESECPCPKQGQDVDYDSHVARWAADVEGNCGNPLDMNKMCNRHGLPFVTKYPIDNDPLLDWHPTMTGDFANITENLTRCCVAYCELRRSAVYTSLSSQDDTYWQACRSVFDVDFQRGVCEGQMFDLLEYMGTHDMVDKTIGIMSPGLRQHRKLCENFMHWSLGTSKHLDNCLPFDHEIDFGFVLYDFMTVVASTAPMGGTGLHASLKDAFRLIAHLANNDLYATIPNERNAMKDLMSGRYNIGSAICTYVESAISSTTYIQHDAPEQGRKSKCRNIDALLLLSLFFLDGDEPFKFVEHSGNQPWPDVRWFYELEKVMAVNNVQRFQLRHRRWQGKQADRLRYTAAVDRGIFRGFPLSGVDLFRTHGVADLRFLYMENRLCPETGRRLYSEDYIKNVAVQSDNRFDSVGSEVREQSLNLYKLRTTTDSIVTLATMRERYSQTLDLR